MLILQEVKHYVEHSELRVEKGPILNVLKAFRGSVIREMIFKEGSQMFLKEIHFLICTELGQLV